MMYVGKELEKKNVEIAVIQSTFMVWGLLEILQNVYFSSSPPRKIILTAHKAIRPKCI